MSSLYKRTEIVGRGKFGVVYKGYNKQTKQVVAIKVLNLDTQEDDLNEVQQEIAFLTDLKNVPNVTHYYGCFLNDTRLWIIMDYCAGGSVRTLLKPGIFDEKYIAVILRELLIALSSVHKLGVIHRDIKSANVLITKEGNVQLCDFGVAAKITSNALKRTTMAGTPYWMAPEVIREGDTYNSKADIWSLGITIYEIATENPPYCDKDAIHAMQLISKSQPPRLEGREYSPVLKECIALCLDENPNERPSADELMKCKLVKLYKNYPKSILKEVITRYLLWRDKHRDRDSVFVKLDENDDKLDLDNNINLKNNDPNIDNSKVQVKWDFDSLSSREYIIENDIDLDKVEELPYEDYNTFTNTNKSENSHFSSISNTLKQSTLGNTTINTEIPKSLQLLFEDNDENETFIPPSKSTYENESVDSPTIEIPDMDNLATYQPQHPHLKPPPLYHSQSASANLESRFTSSNNLDSRLNNSSSNNIFTNNSSTVNNIFSNNSYRSKKSVSSNQSSQNTFPHSNQTPLTPPYSNVIGLKTPSPKPPSTSVLLSSGGKNSSSPSKSMKALNSNTNPLLQPINFKFNEAINSQSLSGPVLPLQPAPNSNPPPQPPKSKRKPGFHIQMPTPNNTFNQMSALTNEGFEKQDEDVNQFGINPATNLPVSMTPVTESNPIAKDMDSYVASREKTDSVSQLRASARKQPPAPVEVQSGTTTTGSLTVPRSVSTGLFSPVNNSFASASQSLRFPVIPPINGEFFIDSTPKSKLINELDNIIKLFNQGLEALEVKL